MSQSKLITLKEASQLSGYSPDYIGQLIRSGKIKGEKVYCQITWMTTAEELMGYKTNSLKAGNNGEGESSLNLNSNFFNFYYRFNNRIISELKFFKIFLANIKTLLPIMVTLMVCLVLLTFFILDTFFAYHDNQKMVSTQNSKDLGVEISTY